MPLTKTRWKTIRSLRKKPHGIVFTTNADGERIRIGGRLFGNVYLGRLHFTNGKTSRIAIKIFKAPLNDQKAKNYQRVINDLRKAGVRLPKMGMVKLPNDEWVQVSQLFDSTHIFKIKTSTADEFRHLTLSQKIEAVQELTKVANAGYLPKGDLSEPFQGKSNGIIPMDIDLIVRHGKQNINERINILLSEIDWMVSNNVEKKKLVLTAIQQAEPELRKLLISHRTTVLK
ncbi:MAG: hypothetical protein Q7S21_06390 [archaeon]|nr:hypothetical protein [archaeon]